VHLQHLGHPIANDQQYGGTYPGPDRAGGRAQPTESSHELHEAQPSLANTPSASEAWAAQALSGRAVSQPKLDQLEDGRTAMRFGERQKVAGQLLRIVQECSTSDTPASQGELCEEGLAKMLLVPPELQDDLCPHCPSMLSQDYCPLDLRPLWLHACR
jgi:hypothetical protein